MTPEEIVQEEANIGAELLGTLKKHAIEAYSWGSFAKLRNVVLCGLSIGTLVVNKGPYRLERSMLQAR